MAACSVLPPLTQEKEKRMRRKRFQRGCLKTRKRNGKNYWYAQWREDGKPKSKEIGLCSKMDRVKAEGILTEILKPINEGAENPEKITWTFAKFCEVVYLPVCHRKWKASTDMVETNRLEVHLVRPLGEKLMQEITRSELQALLDEQARSCGRSMVDHLRFRLRSVFALAMSEGVVDRNPAAALFTPRHYQEGRSREVLTPEQAAILIGALELREKVIVRLATWEGMRPGEILALQMGDLDDDSVWVRRRVYKGDIDEPKTKRSTRRVALTVGTLAMLDQWKLRLLGSPAETWIFGSEKGTPMRRDNIWRKSMYPKLKPVGLEWATFQVTRRTFATLSKAAGVDAHTRSAQMGNTVDVNKKRIRGYGLRAEAGFRSRDPAGSAR
jgi:integrase